jgi:hypothetical protein
MRTFKEFMEAKGNKHPSPQRRMFLSPSIVTKAVMPAKASPDHDPIMFRPKPQRVGDSVGMVLKPKSTISGVLDRPSNKKR